MWAFYWSSPYILNQVADENMNESEIEPMDISKIGLLEKAVQEDKITKDQFISAFDLEKIQEAFDYVSRKKTRGIDGTTLDNFIANKDCNFNIINQKCINGTYRFAPYLQKLQTKGKGKAPRVISIATIRDRIVLHIIKVLLQKAFPECVNRKLPNNYVKEINDFFGKHGEDSSLCYYKTDIKGFYDTIPHNNLLDKVSARADFTSFLTLLEKSIKNPTVSYGSQRARKEDHNKKGVPQGLSISNILADIYLRDFDITLTKMASNYYRFVDDIIIFNFGPEKACLRGNIQEQIKEIGLELNDTKTVCKSENKVFEYLGYRFDLPKITIRSSSVDKFINSVASMICSHKNNMQVEIKKHKWLDAEAYNKILIETLNEKITGAVSENRKYGWLFYFLEINDENLLHRMDRIIESFFERLDEFGHQKPSNLKRLGRAYFEARYNLHSNYIHNYNKYVTLQDKLDYLNKLGKLNPDSKYTEEEINGLFEKTKMQNLMHLENDIGEIS